jgi:hypothetical protein
MTVRPEPGSYCLDDAQTLLNPIVEWDLASAVPVAVTANVASKESFQLRRVRLCGDPDRALCPTADARMLEGDLETGIPVPPGSRVRVVAVVEVPRWGQSVTIGERSTRVGVLSPGNQPPCHGG